MTEKYYFSFGKNSIVQKELSGQRLQTRYSNKEALSDLTWDDGWGAAGWEQMPYNTGTTEERDFLKIDLKSFQKTAVFKY